MSLPARITAALIVSFARAVTAVRGEWRDIAPVPGQRIYFSNHNSHGDFVLVWTVLPLALRSRARPVAGADYWLTSKLKSFIGKDVFNALLIDRNPETRTADPVAQMSTALTNGDSLIFFLRGRATLGRRGCCRSNRGCFTSQAKNRKSTWSRSGSRTSTA